MTGTVELFCPSRERPQAAHELARSFRDSVVDPRTKLVFLLDDDDPTAFEYPEERVIAPGDGTPTGPLDRAAIASAAEIVGFIGDDSRCATKGWDQEVRRALAEPGFAWGCDETGPPVWPSTAFVSSAIVRAIGYFALPTLRRGFFDGQWLSVARGAGIERQLRSRFPHDNHQHPVDPLVIADDERTYRAWLAQGVKRDTAIARHVYEMIHFFRPGDLGVA